jgi:hypothetical protein
MDGDALGRRIVALAAAIALTTACSRSVVSPRDASDTRVRTDGVAEAQPADTTATASAPASAAAARTETGTDGSDPGRDPHRMRRVLGWVALTVGVEAAVIAVATSILIEHQKSIRDDDCNAQKVCSAAGFGAVGTIHTIVPWNTATWFVAAAGLGAGTVLLVTSPKESERTTAITLSPGPSGFGLGVRSTF